MSDLTRTYAYGKDAAEVMGMARAADVHRAVARHGQDYQGTLRVYHHGRVIMYRRDELKEFAAWYRENVTVTRLKNRGRVDDRPPEDRRRAIIRDAVRRVQERT